MALTDEQVKSFHAAYANDGEPGAFARVVRRVRDEAWIEACEACAGLCRKSHGLTDEEIALFDKKEACGGWSEASLDLERKCRALKHEARP